MVSHQTSQVGIDNYIDDRCAPNRQPLYMLKLTSSWPIRLVVEALLLLLLRSDHGPLLPNWHGPYWRVPQ